MTTNNVSELFQKGWKPKLQHQERAPGRQGLLDPQPVNDVTADGKPYKAAGKLEGKSAIVTGGDSGIGRATAILFALEGADLSIVYKAEEEEDARYTEKYILSKVNSCKILLLPFDLRKEENCKAMVQKHVDKYGAIDVLVLNHGIQQANEDLPTLPTQQWHDVFDTNIHSFFYITKAALEYMRPGSSIILDASINPSVGHPELIDYTATKGAIVGFGRALSNQVVGEKGIRVNMVAPGPIWTPLIPPTMTEEAKEKFGVTTPIGRAGQPVEVATCFVFLASADSSYMSGQVLHPNGGTVIA